MFDIQEFIKNNLINGVRNGSFTREYANILAVNYMSKGLIDIQTVQEIDEATRPIITEETPAEEVPAEEETIEEPETEEVQTEEETPIEPESEVL